MALNSVLFGDFSEAEVQSLFTTDTHDLEFVWQSNRCVSAGHPSGDVACGIQHFPSAMLDIPEVLERRVYSSGAASPNIPPNPPTSPVEGESMDPRGSSKLNVNAPAFVPANLSIIGKNNVSAGPPKGDPLQHSPVKKGDRDLNVDDRIATNDHHLRATSIRDDEGVSSPCGDRVQTVGQVTANVPTSVSHPGGASVSTPRTSSSSGSTPPPPSSSNQGKDTPTFSPTSHAPDARTALSHLPQAQPLTCTAVDQTGSPGSSVPASSPPQISNHPSSTVRPPSSETTAVSPTSLSSDIRTPQSPTPTNHAPTPTTTTPAQDSTSSISSALDVNTPTGSLKPAPKSWASIVGGRGSGPSAVATNTPVQSSTAGGGVVSVGQKGREESSTVTSGTPSAAEGSKEEKECELVSVDPVGNNSQLQSLGEQLKFVAVNHDSVSIQPRGLINQGNWCYIHAPLQALLSCPGMHNLLKSLSPYPTLSRTASATPLTDSMVQFFHEFEAYPKSAPTPDVSNSKSRKKRPNSSHKPEFFHGDPFRPDYIYDMLLKIRSTLSYKGRQEDAEEFLGCVLDGLHEEMVLAQKMTSESKSVGEASCTSDGSVQGDEGRDGGTNEEEEEWEQVGPKNKSTITRQTSFTESPITELFGGELRSAVHRQGVKDSATVEPFFSLQLDIQSDDIWTVKDALEALAVKETVQMNTGTQTEVEAQKRITLARLPPILVLHLKRFVFDKTGGSQKLHKHVAYSTEMEIGKELLAPAIKNKLSLPQRSYRLWAVVYHHGKFATGGHYTCDVCHPVCGGWIRMDDSILKPVSEETVLRHSQTANKVAYLLFYRRVDSLQT